jgi:hypothetical protein
MRPSVTTRQTLSRRRKQRAQRAARRIDDQRTTNFRTDTHNLDSGERLHVVERFTRIDPNTLRYRVTVDDPDTWATAWTAEWPFQSTATRMHSVQCHAGNYAIENFLRGVRAEERRQRN